MSLAPRVVLVHRHTELEELVARHGTRGQAAFYLRTRGRRIEDLEARHAEQAAAMVAVSSAIPAGSRRGMVERADLPRFLFGPDDIVVAVGQDGLVANLAKYLEGQLIIGVNPEPRRNPGVLAWFVREAWPSPATGTACTEGTLSAGQEIEVTAESDRLVLFGDGIEDDSVPLTWGQSARLRLADHALRLL